MVGFLSEQRVLIVDVGDASRATLLDVACQIDHARKHRTWRVPQPYEASICVYINIVPLLGKNRWAKIYGSFRIEMIERASEIINTLNFGECER